MKKITIYLTLLISFILSGCAFQNSNNSSKTIPSNLEVSTKTVNIKNLFFCESDSDCIITDSRFPNGCVAASGGCSLSSLNKNILTSFEEKIKNDPNICKSTEGGILRAFCIPNYRLRPICVKNKCSKKEINSKDECKFSWSSMSACIEQLNEK